MSQDTRDPSFVFDLSSPVSAELPLSINVLRDYTLEFEIKVERTLMDLRKCLKEVVRDRDCCQELANTLIKDIEKINSAYESELVTFRAKLDRRGPSPLGTEAEYVQLRSLIVGLEDEITDLTQRFVALDHT